MQIIVKALLGAKGRTMCVCVSAYNAVSCLILQKYSNLEEAEVAVAGCSVIFQKSLTHTR